MKNNIKIKRVAGNGNGCVATLQIEFNAEDKAAVRRFARILRDLIPKDERAQFVADFQAAAGRAGFRVAS